MGRQIVTARVASDNEYGMSAANRRVTRVINGCVMDASLTQFFQPLAGMCSQFLDLSKLNRFGRTNPCACRDQASFLTVIAKRALERAAILRMALDHPERAGRHAISATIANIRLYENSAKFCSHDRTRGTRFQATRFLAVLADIRRERPRRLLSGVPSKTGHWGLLYKLHVPPGRSANGARIVVREPAPVKPVVINPVPLLARDLACFAANAQGRIS